MKLIIILFRFGIYRYVIKSLKEERKLLTLNSEFWLPLREQEKFGTREGWTGDARGDDNTAFFELGRRYIYVLYIIIP